MLPYQPNCDSPPAPTARTPAPAEGPLPFPGLAAAAFFIGFSVASGCVSSGSFSKTAFAFAISFFIASAAVSLSSSFSAGVGFIFGDGFDEAFAKTIFFGEGLGVGFGVGVGVGFGLGFGVTFTFGLGLIFGVGLGVAGGN